MLVGGRHDAHGAARAEAAERHAHNAMCDVRRATDRPSQVSESSCAAPSHTEGSPTRYAAHVGLVAAVASAAVTPRQVVQSTSVEAMKTAAPDLPTEADGGPRDRPHGGGAP